jgi:DNA polymerase-3 subunit alpha
VLIRGSVSGRDRDEDAPPIFLDSVVSLAHLRANGSLAVELSLPSDAAPDVVTRAAQAFRDHPGQAPLYVNVTNGGNGGPVRLRSRTVHVAPTQALLHELRELLGSDRVRLVRS